MSRSEFVHRWVGQINVQASVAPGYVRQYMAVEQHLRDQEIAAVGCLRIWWSGEFLLLVSGRIRSTGACAL